LNGLRILGYEGSELEVSLAICFLSEVIDKHLATDAKIFVSPREGKYIRY